MELKAWFNGYECVAANTADEAKAILTAGGYSIDAEGLEGDGWVTLSDDRVIRDEDGNGETIREMLAACDGPKHLYSCEP